MDTEDTKRKVLMAVIDLFNEYGLKFTMNSLARKLGMSKKTLYVLFESKEDLLNQMVDYCFASVKESEAAALAEPGLDTPGRIRALLAAFPEQLQGVSLENLYVLRETYPKIYTRVEQYLENGWEPTIRLLEQGIAEGSVRPFSIPMFKMMYELALEQFFRRDILKKNAMTYREGLQEVTDLLVDGILAHPEEKRGKES
ncbi:MAG: TetR/AcrR family transcriptional regulator [Lachnospira sp.]|nr:TetR/AcrR family transcriptional regulator [Lachnospira sp.]